jgi:hypothetical protein
MGGTTTTYMCYTLQRTNPENPKQIFPEKELRGHSPNFHFLMSERFKNSQHRSACSAAGTMWTVHRHMNVEIGTEAAKFTEKE